MNNLTKSKSPLRTLILTGPIAAALALTLGTIDASAANGTWTAAATANWSTTADWTGGIVADGAGFSATFTPAIGSTSRTVTLDTARTLGAITMSPTTTSNRSLTIKGLGANTLTFDNTPNSANAQLNFTTNRSGIMSVASILLNSSLDINDTGSSGANFLGGGSITNNSAGAKTISFIGTNTVSFEVDESITDGTGGNGTLALTLNANRLVTLQGGSSFVLTYSGPTTITQGTLQQTNGANSLSANSAMIINGGALDLFGLSQTVGSLSGSGGIITSSQSTARTLTVNQTVDGAYSGVIGVSGNANANATALTKAGSAMLTLSGANTFTGATTVNGGTLAASAASGQALGGTTAVNISGGTLQFGASNQINPGAAVTLGGGNGGGTFNAAGNSQTAGTVALSASSTINFGTPSVGPNTVIAFANSSLATWAGGATLSIYDWNGSPSGGGTDELFFGSDATGLTPTELGQINFYSDLGITPLGTAQILPNGEVVPVAAPEPGSLGLLLVGTVALLGRRRRE